MTFEQKTLVLMAIEGPLDTSKIPFLTSNRKVISISNTQHIVLYGIDVRQENDAEEALNHSIQLRTPQRKIYVATEIVLFQNQTPHLEWKQNWSTHLHLLTVGEIGVSLDLVRIYQRIFDIHAKRVKNESVFILERKKITPARIRGLRKKYSPLVGRKKELSNLLEVIEQSFEDQGQIASIIGDAGLGKTRLKVELTTELEKRKIKFYEGYFSLNSDLNFRGFHQLVKQVLEQNAETFSRWDLNESESAFLRYFLHPEEKNPIVQDLNEEEQTQGIFHSIQKLFANAGQQPIVFILDDFHWAGERSIKLMELLAQSFEKTKIAFFIVHRPSFVPSFQKRLNYHQIKLPPLEHNETKELVKNALNLDFVTDGAIQTLSNLSLGNPLYVEEVLRELIGRKELDLQKADDVVRLIEVQFPKGAIPTNIHSLITARLDLLSKDAKKVLQWVCAFGFRENQDDFELFLQTLDLPIEIFHQLFEQGYLEEASMFPEHKYKFQHDLLYETIKQSVPESEWISKNQQIAEFLKQLYQHEMIIQGDRIADFFMKGEMGPRSFNPLFEAAKIALEQKRYSSAVKYFDACFTLFNQISKDDQLSVYDFYLDALFASGEKDKIQKILNQWKMTVLPNHESEIKYYKKHLEYLYTYRDMNSLPEVSRQAVERFKNSSFTDDLIVFEVRYFQSLAFLFKFDEAVHIGLKILRKLNDSQKHLDLKVDIFYGLGFITQQIGYPNVGSYLTLIAKDAADATNNLKLKITVQKRIAFLATAQGYYKEAVRIWSDLIHTCEQQGYQKEIFLFKNNRMLNNYFIGNYSSVLSEAKYLDDFDRLDWYKKFIVNWVGQTYLTLGAFDQAKQIIAEHRYFPSKDPYIRSNLLYLAGNYHYQQNTFKKAAIFYRFAKELYEKKDQKIYALQMQLFELRCKLLLKETDTDTAAKEFDQIISTDGMRKYFYEWNAQMMSFWFARHGCNIKFKPSEDFDPMKCNAVYLRMMMFVEKIKWLQYIGKSKKAEEVKKQYLAHRQEMAFYVPDEFKQSYLNHPFYQV
jgi:hypothetical protein